MNVLQLIDTLNAGGAERVAVNYANLIYNEYGESYLSTTRSSGVLKNDLLPQVSYNNVQRKSTFDIGALIRFKRYIKNNNISIIHAHTTSYFFAVLAKLLLPKLKIVWHDHQGNRDEIKAIRQWPLIMASFFFDGVITVNQRLQNWGSKYLYCKNIIHIDNFVTTRDLGEVKTKLYGHEGKRIVSIANLKSPKNHLHLLKAFKAVNKTHEDWSLHLIGKDFKDLYSKELFRFIQNHNLENSIFIYGLRNDIQYILSQCDIGVVASTYEGLPMALLEYGNAELAIITSDVGSCKELVESRGIVVEVNNVDALADAFINLIEDSELRKDYAVKIKKYIDINFSENAITTKIISFYRKLN